MSAETGGSVEIGGMTITSTTQSADEIRADFAPETPETVEEDDPSKAAAVLGKRGAEAAAEKRKAEAKEAKREAKRQAKEDAGAESDPDPDPEPKLEDQRVEDRRKGNPRHDPQARVAQATREAREAREEAAAARAEAARIRAELDAARAPKQPEPPPRPRAEGRPKSEDFDSWDQYEDALMAYNRQQWTAEMEQRSRAQAREQEYTKRVKDLESAYTASMVEAKKADPDFWSKISPEVSKLWPTFKLVEQVKAGQIAPDDPIFHDARTWMADEIVHNAAHAPALLLHLSESEEFQRLAALSTPRSVTLEIGKIIKGLEAATTAPSSRQSVSKAPPPVRPVTGAPITDSGELDDNAPLSAFVKRYGQRELSSTR